MKKKKEFKKLNQFLIELENIFPYYYFESSRTSYTGYTDHMIHIHTHQDVSSSGHRRILLTSGGSLGDVTKKAWAMLLESKDKDVREILVAMGEVEDNTNTDISASDVEPDGKTWYTVTDTHEHESLEVGDKVMVVEPPVELTGYNNFIVRSDLTLHTIYTRQDVVNTPLVFVTLRPVDELDE